MQERGFARPKQFRLRLNVHDGWTWHRLDLIGDGPHLDHEARLPEFFAWMVQWVAHHRAQASDVSDEERDELGRIASGATDFELTEHRAERGHCVSRSLLMPGARPVSVELAS